MDAKNICPKCKEINPKFEYSKLAGNLIHIMYDINEEYED
jgi:phage FluMu protein Com